MEGEIQEKIPEQVQNPSSPMSKFIIPTTILALIVFAAIGFYVYQSNNNAGGSLQSSPEAVRQSQTPAESTSAQSAYKNGSYSVAGEYVSPGGPRKINVTLTLEGDVITEATAEATATDATSKRFQGEFVDGFGPMVIGKNIEEVSLTKVAGSSLTPKGFNDALEKIKVEAKS